VQEVQGDRLSQKANADVFQSLQGKVAGLNISQTSGAPGAGSTILIRGATSLASSNRNGPLIVVDGMPIDNTVLGTDVGSGSAEVFGSAAFGNRGMDLNPEDIASVNVLKGPSAAALYGIRAANGAIVITTKRGSQQKKLSATITSSYTLSRVNILPRYQNSYGQGLTGRHHSAVSSNSWGRAFGAVQNDSITDHNNDRVPYRSYPNNVSDFFNDGHLINNNVQLSGGVENANFILSVGNTQQSGIIPESQMKRTNIRLGGGATLANRLNIDGNFSYINTKVEGSPQGNNGSSVFFVLPTIPRSYDLMGRPVTRPDGSQDFYAANDNPRWSVLNNPVTSTVNRFLGSAGLNYDIFEWLNASYRVGFDVYGDARKEVYGRGSNRFSQGQITDDNISYQSIESNFILNAKRKFGEDFDLNVNVGHNVNSTKRDRFIVTGVGIATPGINNILNTETVTVDGRNGTVFNRRLVGIFGEASLGFRNFLFLTVSGRNDWSSTLPKQNNSFFYPSASLSVDVTEALGLSNDVISFAKVRGNWARVGNDADPFLTSTVYSVPNFGNNVARVKFPFGGQAGFNLLGTKGNDQLKPEQTTGRELGAEVSLFRNRLSVDFTYYNQETIDQILFLQIPASTGFTQYITNAGSISNKGIELLVSGSPIKTNSFQWEATVNFARNRNKVNRLAEGLTQTQLQGFIGAGSFAVEGEPLGVFVAPKFARDSITGKLLVINTGLSRGTLLPGPADQVVGNPNPDWSASLINNFTFKGFRLGVQVDMQKGGDIFSNTIGFGTVLGSLEETGVDRDKPRIIDGVLATPTGEIVLDDQGNRVPNNIQVTAETYWRSFSGGFNEFAVFDASHIRLREITLGYSLPKRIIDATPFGVIDVSLSARNLFTYAPNLRHIDPEVANITGALGRGLEWNSSPGVANYGVNLKLTF
jgi:TonB-linked SusC/RagA family outer membrane protein